MDIKVMDAMFAAIRTVFTPDSALSDTDADLLRRNLNNVYMVSNRSDMAQIVGYALEKQGLITQDDEMFSQFQEKQYIAMIKCEEMCYELDRMRALFEENQIDFIPLKGAVIREMYPEPWMRTSSDIDILIHPEDLSRATHLLVKKLGYSTGKESGHDHSFFTPQKVHVELHFNLMESGVAKSANEILDSVWDYAEKRENVKHEYELNEGMFYFYQIAHMAKHTEGGGSGMRSFLDLWLINQRFNNENHERDGLLATGNLEDFNNHCCAVSNHWFGGSEFPDNVAEKFALFVLNCGTYGSMENRIAVLHGDSGGTLTYIKRRICLSKEIMRCQYPILKHHGWLLPFCHIARWCKLFSTKMIKKIVKEIKISRSATDEKVEEMQSFLAEIGLK